MFGYVLPEKPELKIREYEIFRAYYCGVCKSIGRRHGQFHRIVLNYDLTFLALLLSSLAGEQLEIKKERCIAHPLNKRFVVKNSEIVDYASDMNLILAYYNLKDDWSDEKSIKAGTGKFLLRRSFKKLRQKYHKKCDIIERRLAELAELERDKCSSIDRAAEPFAKLMEEILIYDPLCKNKKNKKILKWIGYNLGKWIYILDAYDDIEDDIKSENYNPLLYQYRYNSENIEAAAFKKKIKNSVEFNLMYTLDQIAKAYELFGIKVNSGLLENIIYMGMLRKTEKILKIGGCREVEKSIRSIGN